ncbi:TPA: LysR family transcriptional regulator [Klebsiella pneumoniae]|nr:LysR family transcriptional regulator [Klebsiella pneumoniae]
MKPLLDVLVILDALEKEGSFAAASAKLFKTPSALSYTIHRLESDLNIQLLDRSGHRARFTPSGQMLLEKGREVLHIARELEIRAVKLQQGWENSLRLAVDSTFPVALLRLGLGWGCLPRYQVQGLLDSGELVCMTVRGLSPRQRAWIAWNDATCGLAGKWWRETLLANSAIFTIYHTETV